MRGMLLFFISLEALVLIIAIYYIYDYIYVYIFIYRDSEFCTLNSYDITYVNVVLALAVTNVRCSPGPLANLQYDFGMLNP